MGSSDLQMTAVKGKPTRKETGRMLSVCSLEPLMEVIVARDFREDLE